MVLVGRQAVLAAFLATSAAVPTQQAASSTPRYPFEGNVDCDFAYKLRYGFTKSRTIADHGFTGSELQWVQEGIESWNMSQGSISGGLLLNSERDDSIPLPSTRTRVYRDTSIAPAIASVTCDSSGFPERIRFNDQALGADPDYWRRVAAHEAGHAHGMSHTGDGDSTIGGGVPSMSTCLNSQQEPTRAIGIDDVAQVNFQRYGILNANPGFEQGNLQYWSATNGAVERIQHSPYQGSDYANFTANGSQLEQTIHVEWPVNTSRTFEVRARYKFVAGAQGDFNFKVFGRGRNFPTGSNCATDGRYTNNQNFNEPYGWTGGPDELLNVSTTVFSTTWRELATSAGNTDFTVNGAEMHSLRLLVTNGGDQHAFLDNLQIREV